MGKIWNKIKSIISGNIWKNLRKIVERTGVWLIALLNITIPVFVFLVAGISEIALRTAAEAAYIATIEYACFGIGQIFKNGNNHS